MSAKPSRQTILRVMETERLQLKLSLWRRWRHNYLQPLYVQCRKHEYETMIQLNYVVYWHGRMVCRFGVDVFSMMIQGSNKASMDCYHYEPGDWESLLSPNGFEVGGVREIATQTVID